MIQTNIKNFLLIFSILALIALGCNFSRTYLNLEEDQTAGKQFTNTFYRYVKEQQFDQLINQYASDSLSIKIGKEKVKQLFVFVNGKIGTELDHKVIAVETKRVSLNGVNTVYYMLKSRVNYQKGAIDEVLGLIKNGKDSIKIASYNVYSDLLLQP